MLQNVLSVAVVIGALRVNPYPAIILRVLKTSAAYIQVHLRLEFTSKKHNMISDQTAPKGTV